MPKAEQLTDAVAYHGEGPMWDGLLHFVDMLAGDLLTLERTGEITRRHVGSVLAALRPRVGGGYVYAVERGFALDDGPGTALQPLPEIWQDTAVRMNEGGCDPDGRFYCGSMAYEQSQGAAALYRLDADGEVSKIMTGLTISNGLEWDPVGNKAYYVDTDTGRIDMFDYDLDGGLSGRREFVDVRGGSPDGLTVDAEGGVWVALFGGRAVHRYDLDRALSEVVEVSATQVTACTFGGDDLSDLYITTSRQGLGADDEPSAGAVFVHRPDVKGFAVRPFSG